jgi:DNA modification methylase
MTKKKGNRRSIQKKDTTSKVDRRNKINDLDGREWIRFTKSWFVEDGKRREITDEIESHPASFPPSMIREFIEFFTKKGDMVLDMFVGTGSTLVACDDTGRIGTGIELVQKYADTTRKRISSKQTLMIDDARTALRKLKEKSVKFKMCINSPPYWNMLTKEKDYVQQERKSKKLDLRYSSSSADLGNLTEYSEYLDNLVDIYTVTRDLLVDGGHLIIVVQNIRDKNKTVPIAFDLATRLSEIYYFQGERIWCQSQKELRPYGYPYSFVPNVHHHYCLVFKNRAR